MELNTRAMDISDNMVRKRLQDGVLTLSLNSPKTLRLNENSSTGFLWMVETSGCAAMGLSIDEEVFYSNQAGQNFVTGAPDVRLVTLVATKADASCTISL